jgi:hypothetical protein
LLPNTDGAAARINGQLSALLDGPGLITDDQLELGAADFNANYHKTSNLSVTEGLRHPLSQRVFLNPERGCVVLDQPQHATKPQPIGLVSRAAAGLRRRHAPFLKQALRSIPVRSPVSI